MYLISRYIKRKQEKEAAEASARASKSLKAATSMSERDSVFGDILQPIPSAATSSSSATRKPLSPRVTIPASTGTSGNASPFSPRAKAQRTGTAGTPKSGLSAQIYQGQDENARAGIHVKVEDKPGGGEIEMRETGMGVKDEAMGMVSGGMGLREVGRSLEDDG